MRFILRFSLIISCVGRGSPRKQTKAGHRKSRCKCFAAIALLVLALTLAARAEHSEFLAITLRALELFYRGCN